jgi:hypothetical protein
MQINVTFDQSVSSLPTGFVAAVDYVVNLYDSLFTNAVTVNIDVGYGEIGGQSLESGALGESEAYLVSPTYAEAVSALTSDATSTLQKDADATVPASAPYSSGNLWMSTAQAKALGLLSPTSGNLDGYVGFSSSLPFSYATTGTPVSGQYDFVSVVEHEISEVMGRASYIGADINGAASFSLMDLFRYSAPGVRDLTATPPSPYTGAYFSVNNGTTNLDNWNTASSGDLGDWAASAGADAYLAFSWPGQLDGLSSADYALMNVLGWDLTPPVTTVTSMTASPASGALTVGQVVTITMGLSAAVSVSGGTPYLALNDGGTATYNAAATAALNNPSELVFSYTVGAADHTAAALAVVGGSLNGASLTDEFGNIPNFAGSYVSFSGLSLTTPAATVTSVTALPGSGVESVGQTIAITVAMSKGVSFTGGTPTLALNDGGTATFNAAATAALNNPAELVFTYTVAASDNSVSTLAIVSGNLNGAVALDASGNSPNFSGLFASFGGLGVTTPAAAVTAVATTPTSGTEGVGQTLAITYTFSKGVVFSGGTPTLTLNDGGTAVYNAAATAALGDPTRLVFDYTVASTDRDVATLAAVGGNLNGAVATDIYGGVPNFAGLFTSFPNVAVQTVAPASVASFVASPASGVEGVGETITLTATMTGAVTFTGGTPSLTLNDGGTAVYNATATAALGNPDQLVFTYTVGATDQNAAGLSVVGGSLNGATAADANGNIPNFAGLYTSFPGLTVATSGIDLAAVSYGANTTLGYTPNSGDTGGTVSVTDGVHTETISLIGQYAALSFVTLSDGHSGTLVADPSLTGAALTTFLASPHT